LVNIYLNEELVESIHFPITDVGDSSTVTIKVQNPLEENVELIAYAEDPDVEVVSYPKNLKPMESGVSVFRFSPKAKRLSPLRSVVGFKEIIG